MRMSRDRDATRMLCKILLMWALKPALISSSDEGEETRGRPAASMAAKIRCSVEEPLLIARLGSEWRTRASHGSSPQHPGRAHAPRSVRSRQDGRCGLRPERQDGRGRLC